MARTFRSVVSASVLLAACSVTMPAAAAPLSVSSQAFVGMDTGALRHETVATRPKSARAKPVRSTAKSRKSSGVGVTTGDLDGDGKPDTVTTKPKTRPITKPTSKPSATGGVHVQ